MIPLFQKKLFSGWHFRWNGSWRAVVLLLIFALLQAPTAANAVIPAQSTLPLPPRQLEPPDKSYVAPPAVTFRWAPTEGAQRYILDIFREDHLPNDEHSVEIIVTGATTYTYTGLEPGYTYAWFVRVDFPTSGTNHDAFEFTLSNQQLAPPAPLELTASDGLFRDEIQISWNPSYRTAYYLLQRRAPGEQNFIDLARVGEEGTYVDQEGETDEHMEYRVLACNHLGCSPPSPIDEGWEGSCQPISAPTLVSPAEGAEIFISRQDPWYRLEWNSVPGAGGYILHVWDRDTGNLLERVVQEGEQSTSWEIDGIVGNLTWSVTAMSPVEGCESSAPSAKRNYTAAFYPPPPSPTNLEASDGAFADQIRLTWDQPAPSDDVEAWEIWRASSADPNQAVRIGSAYPDREYTDTDVTPGALYYYWVKSCSHADGCSQFSTSDSGYAGNINAEIENPLYIPIINR